MINIWVSILKVIPIRLLNGVTAKNQNELGGQSLAFFLRILDPEGNKIELWEPVDQVLEDYDNEYNV